MIKALSLHAFRADNVDPISSGARLGRERVSLGDPHIFVCLEDVLITTGGAFGVTFNCHDPLERGDSAISPYLDPHSVAVAKSCPQWERIIRCQLITAQRRMLSWFWKSP